MTMTQDLIRSEWARGVVNALNEFGEPITHYRIMADPVVHKSTIEGLIVPWDSPTWVADDMPDGTRKFYQEGFRQTAVDRQLFGSEDRKRSNAGRVMFRHMHSRADGFGPLGIGREFEVRDEGLWGEFHIIERERATLASLIEHGISGLSVEFRERPDGTEKDGDGVVWRTDVQLNGVALEWAGAYPEAQVLAMRAEVDEGERERGETEQVERERADAEAAEVAAAKERDEKAAAKAQAMRELDEWTAEQARVQAELAARYG